MDNTHLFSQILSLPADLKKEVSDFVEFLTQKSKNNKQPTKRTFGYAKGFFKMDKDFDQPLDDFKDYQ